MKSGNFRELLIDHSCKVHYIVFIWKLLYEVCLVQIKEQMGDNPLDIPFQIWPHTTNGDSVRLLWSNSLM